MISDDVFISRALSRLMHSPGFEHTLAAIIADPGTKRLTRLKAAALLVSGVSAGTFQSPPQFKSRAGNVSAVALLKAALKH